MKPNFFFNSFTDLNYAAPMLLRAAESLELVFYLDDLKRAKKVFFRELSKEFLSFEFVQRHNVRVLETPEALQRYLKEYPKIIVSSTPTLQQLFQRGSLKTWNLLQPRPQLIGLDYFHEGTEKIMRYLDQVYLSSPVWNHHYQAEKVVYGLPYWDLFRWPDVTRHEENVSFDSKKENILIPEITQDGDSWFADCFTYIDTHNDPVKHFYLKYRLKTKVELTRNEELENKLRRAGHTNFTSVYTPYFFTTARLLEACNTVVFTTNATLMIVDCIAAGASIERAYDAPRLDVWQEPAANTACDDYVLNATVTRANLIWNQGKSTEQLLNNIGLPYAEGNTVRVNHAASAFTD